MKRTHNYMPVYIEAMFNLKLNIIFTFFSRPSSISLTFRSHHLNVNLRIFSAGNAFAYINSHKIFYIDSPCMHVVVVIVGGAQ